MSELQSIAFRLDFNEFYHERTRKGNITMTFVGPDIYFAVESIGKFPLEMVGGNATNADDDDDDFGI